MEQWNDAVLKRIEAIASEAARRSDEASLAERDGTLDSKGFVYYSTSRGVAVCRMLFDTRGAPEDFLLESVNPAFCTLFGANSENTTGRKGSDFFFGGGRNVPGLEFFSKALTERESFSLMLYLEKFGKVFDILVFSPGGEIFCMVFSDASRHAVAERERRENERFTESVLGSVDVWIALIDEQGRVVFWNGAAERMSGISAEEALSGGFDFWSIFSEEENVRESVLKQLDRRRNGVSKFRLETGVCDDAGKCIRVEWTIRTWNFEDVGAEGLLFLGRDVTETRRMEEELEESERRYAAAFRETRAPMLLVDPETGAVCDCNDAALALYGYSREEMLALTNRDFNLLSEKELRKNMEEAKNRGKNRFVFPHRLKNGEIRTVEVYASPMPFQGRTYLFSILHDITEKQRLEEQLSLFSFDCALQAKILGGILESSSDYLYVFDRGGRACFSGKKGAALFDRKPEEMVGLSWELLGIPKERVAVFGEHLAEVFAGGRSKYGVIVLPARTGEMPLEYALHAVCNDTGGVDMVFCSMRRVP